MKVKPFFIFCISAICCVFMQTSCTYEEFTSSSGSCGTNLKWTFDYETGLLNITGKGSMNYGGWNTTPPWKKDFESHEALIKSVIIEEGVITVADYAFYNCVGVSTITIPSSVTNIGMFSFGNSYSPDGYTNITSVVCYANNPPKLHDGSFDEDRTKNSVLYIPSGSINAYKSSEWNKYFDNILPIE